MHVLIFVTHLLGTGHLSRALTLGRAFVRFGHKVDLVSGGTVVANLDYQGITLHQLPPVKSDGVNFTRLLCADDQLTSADYLQNRRAQACAIILQTAPDVLITELYPFGRRILRDEFNAILETAKNLPKKPHIFCSIRDILAPPSTTAKVGKTEAVIVESYDGVLVHSDSAQIPLDVSWPVSTFLESKLNYTGYVAPPMPAPHLKGIGKGEVLVTAGGGGVGAALFQVAVEAARQDKNRQWRLLVGGGDALEQIAILREQAGSLPITIEPTRPDFRQMLHHADAAVAMCGYNTAMDLLQTGTPAVFVPFDVGGEQEQSLRADSLAKKKQFAVVKTAVLTKERLLEALQQVVRNPCPPSNSFDGANETVRIITRKVGLK